MRRGEVIRSLRFGDLNRQHLEGAGHYETKDRYLYITQNPEVRSGFSRVGQK